MDFDNKEYLMEAIWICESGKDKTILYDPSLQEIQQKQKKIQKLKTWLFNIKQKSEILYHLNEL